MQVLCPQGPEPFDLGEIAGTHHPDGVFIAYGPGVAPGKTIGRRRIMDVGATLLYSLGLPVPSDFVFQPANVKPVFARLPLLVCKVNVTPGDLNWLAGAVPVVAPFVS